MCETCSKTIYASRCPCCAEESNESEYVGFELFEGNELLIDDDALRDAILLDEEGFTAQCFDVFLAETGGNFDDLEESNALLHDFADWINER